MCHQAGLRKERLISHFLLFVMCLCLGAAAQGVERIRYYINDPSGNPLMVLGPDGSILARYAYTPTGAQVPATATTHQRLGFVGGIRETSGMHYLKHRYYNPQIGRFYQPDPVGFLQRGPSQINRYGYGLNDPYTYQDKDGRCLPACAALIPLAIWVLDNFRSDMPSSTSIPPSGMGDAALMGYGIGQMAVAARVANMAAGASATGLASVARLEAAGANAESALSTTRLALPAPRQIEAAWGASTYRAGGLMTGIEHIMYRHGANSGFTNVSKFAEGTSMRDVSLLVDSALRYGRVIPSGSNAFIVEYSLGRAIGTNIGGGAASSLRVYVRDGVIQTAFPY